MASRREPGKSGGTVPRAGLLVSALVALALGCGSAPYPNVIIEGTTGMITVPIGFELGYGTRMMSAVFTPDVNDATASQVFDISDPSTHLPYDPSAPQVVARAEDLQRGETLLTLLRASGEPVLNSNGTPVYLRVVYVGRVMVDQTSDYTLGRTDGRRGLEQSVIFFDVPTGLVPDDDADGIAHFGIRVDRIRRSAADLDQFEIVPQGLFEDRGFTGAAAEWLGWTAEVASAPAADPIPIVIADAPEDEADESTSFSGTAGAEAQSIASTVAMVWSNQPQVNSQRMNLFDVRPNPEVRFTLPSPLSESTTPAAYSMDVQFPPSKIEIVNVRLLRRNPSGAVVFWSAPPRPSSPCTVPSTQRDTLNVQVADPEPDFEKRAYGVSVVYRLINTWCGQPGQNPIERLLPGEVVRGSIQAYDFDGQPLATEPPLSIVAADLR